MGAAGMHRFQPVVLKAQGMAPAVLHKQLGKVTAAGKGRLQRIVRQRLIQHRYLLLVKNVGPIRMGQV